MQSKKGKSVLLIVALFCFSRMPVFSQIWVTIKGHVYEKEGNKPIAEVKVIVLSTKNQALKYELQTDKNGSFYKSGLQSGIYQITCQKSGYEPAATTVGFSLGETREVVITLDSIKQQTNTVYNLIIEVEKLINGVKYQEVVDKITAAGQNEPLIYILYYYRGVAYEKLGDQQKSLADFLKAIELKPDFILATGNIGKLYAKLGDFSKASAYYKKAYEAGLTDIPTLYNYGVCLVNLANNAEAKAVFEKLLTIDPVYADAYYQLGIINLGLGDMAKAKECFNKLIELEPENKNVPVAKDILKKLN